MLFVEALRQILGQVACDGIGFGYYSDTLNRLLA
jgi:hypothetical protein